MTAYKLQASTSRHQSSNHRKTTHMRYGATVNLLSPWLAWDIPGAGKALSLVYLWGCFQKSSAWVTGSVEKGPALNAGSTTQLAGGPSRTKDREKGNPYTVFWSWDTLLPLSTDNRASGSLPLDSRTCITAPEGLRTLPSGWELHYQILWFQDFRTETHYQHSRSPACHGILRLSLHNHVSPSSHKFFSNPYTAYAL